MIHKIEWEQTDNTYTCALCGEPILTFKPVQIIFRGQFSLKKGFEVQDFPLFQHDDCEDIE